MTEELIAADEALSESNWHEAAELYSRAIRAAKRRCQESGGAAAGVGGAGVLQLALSLRGRARCLAEIGRKHGNVSSSPDILKQAVGDARSAVALTRHAGRPSELAGALCTLSEVLTAADQSKEADLALREAEKIDPTSAELRATSARVQQRNIEAEMDSANDDGRSPGTFRWPRGKALPTLPTLSVEEALSPTALERSWEQYLRTRGGEALVAIAQTNAMLLDGLSFPLSLAWVLLRSGAVNWNSQDSAGTGELHVVVLGAMDKAEVRIAAETSYWQELARLLQGRCRPRLHFLGPEAGCSPGTGDAESVHEFEPPCAKRFFREHPHMDAKNTVCVVYNGGFGNFVASGKDELLWSWLPDLAFLGDRGYLCAFFCANDYADVKGETITHAALLGSQFVLTPQRNPFSMATVYQGEAGTEGASEWFCGNSFVYGTCGREDAARPAADFDNLDTTSKRKLKSEVLQHCTAGQETSLAVMTGEPPTLYPLTPSPMRPSSGSPSTTEARVSEAHETVVGVQPSLSENLPAKRPEVSLSRTDEDTGAPWMRLDVLLPGISSIADVDLDISDTSVSLGGACGYTLQEAWPEPVDSAKAAAAFSSKREKLTIKAPIRNR